MFRNERVRIKQSGWFPAGTEMRRALGVLSDGAFRVYFHLCLVADHRSGTVSANYGELARTLLRSRRSIATYMEELRHAGICAVRPATNQHGRNEIEISDEFWPYMKASRLETRNQPGQYTEGIRKILAARACVRCAFTRADEKLASAFADRGLAYEQVERGILLGCTRKYVSLLNGSDRAQIVSLAYFTEAIEEAGDMNTPGGYWEYIRYELERLETRWKANAVADAKHASAPVAKKQTR